MEPAAFRLRAIFDRRRIQNHSFIRYRLFRFTSFQTLTSSVRTLHSSSLLLYTPLSHLPSAFGCLRCFVACRWIGRSPGLFLFFFFCRFTSSVSLQSVPLHDNGLYMCIAVQSLSLDLHHPLPVSLSRRVPFFLPFFLRAAFPLRFRSMVLFFICFESVYYISFRRPYVPCFSCHLPSLHPAI